jgi:hypothetical protein
MICEGLQKQANAQTNNQSIKESHNRTDKQTNKQRNTQTNEHTPTKTQTKVEVFFFLSWQPGPFLCLFLAARALSLLFLAASRPG